VARNAARGVPLAVQEGVLLPILGVCLAMAAFAAVGALLVREPGGMLRSLTRLTATGSYEWQFDIPQPAAGAAENVSHPVDVSFQGRELRRFRLSSDEPLVVSTTLQPERGVDPLLDVRGGKDFSWVRGEEGRSPFGHQPVARLYVQNMAERPARLRVTAETAPPYPEVVAMPVTALGVIGVFLLYLLQAGLVPKTSAIALATAKSEMAQPLYAINLALGCFLLILFVFVPYNTFGEDIKMLKDSGLTLILVLCIIQAVWGASTSVADEIEGRTALTVLSKPIGRRQFIFGKFLGIIWSVGLMFILLGFVFLVMIAYKPVYDARETANVEPTWVLCYQEVVRTVPGLVLAFLETVVLAALSVAIATRLPMLANFVICFSIYVLGHLTPLIVQSSVGEFEPVVFMGQLIATIFPVLDHFNIQAAVAAGVAVPLDYLGMALVYCILYTTIAMLLALVLFEDRDLA